MSVTETLREDYGIKRLIVGPRAGESGVSGLRCRFRTTGDTVPAFLDEEDNRYKCEYKVNPCFVFGVHTNLLCVFQERWLHIRPQVAGRAIGYSAIRIDHRRYRRQPLSRESI